MPLWDRRGEGEKKWEQRTVTAGVSMCLFVMCGGGAQTAQREWCIQYMCRGRTTGVGTSTTYGANINCTCIMNPTNVTGYMTENKKKIKPMEQSVSVFFFLLSVSKLRERKKKGKCVTVSTSIDHTRSSSGGV